MARQLLFPATLSFRYLNPTVVMAQQAGEVLP